MWRMAAQVNGLQPPSNFVASAADSAPMHLVHSLLLSAMTPEMSMFSVLLRLAVVVVLGETQCTSRLHITTSSLANSKHCHTACQLC